MISNNHNINRDTQPDLRKKIPTILAIGGGKGGVGKTVIAASMGVGLAMLKKQTVVVDADFGGADLHTVMGIEKPNKTYLNFYNRECRQLKDILIPHPNIENLRIISGAIGTLGMANLSHYQKQKFIRHMKKIAADYIIIDLGAGSSYNVLDLFLSADRGIVVVNPDPLSILESYNFVKQILFRQIAQTIRNHNGALQIIREITQTETHRSKSTVEDLIQKVSTMDTTLCNKIETFLQQFHPMLMTNMMVDPEDEENILAIKSAAQELLSTEMEYIGALHKDDSVIESVKKMTPFISYDKKSQASRDLSNIVIMKILHTGRFQSLRAKHTIRRKGKLCIQLPKTETICSVNCVYWEDCGFKKGGYPCELKHYVGIRGFQKE